MRWSCIFCFCFYFYFSLEEGENAVEHSNFLWIFQWRQWWKDRWSNRIDLYVFLGYMAEYKTKSSVIVVYAFSSNRKVYCFYLTRKKNRSKDRWPIEKCYIVRVLRSGQTAIYPGNVCNVFHSNIDCERCVMEGKTCYKVSSNREGKHGRGREIEAGKKREK